MLRFKNRVSCQVLCTPNKLQKKGTHALSIYSTLLLSNQSLLFTPLQLQLHRISLWKWSKPLRCNTNVASCYPIPAEDVWKGKLHIIRKYGHKQPFLEITEQWERRKFVSYHTLKALFSTANSALETGTTIRSLLLWMLSATPAIIPQKLSVLYIILLFRRKAILSENCNRLNTTITKPKQV